MSKRSRSLPLEWKTDQVTITDTTSATAQSGVIDLDLNNDEIAEILGIDQTISPGTTGEADNVTEFGMYLSMDPDASSNPLTLANIEDLEVFFTHYMELIVLAAGTPANLEVDLISENKQMWLPEKYPILVGTNIAQVVNAEGAVDITTQFITTIYFRRRKANAMELNQILLKRR